MYKSKKELRIAMKVNCFVKRINAINHAQNNQLNMDTLPASPN
jgi:hypothetical protein